MVLLPPGHSLALPSVLAAVRTGFEDAGCALLYAPHRGPNGELGAAQPAASAAEHDAHGPALAADSTLCFRASLHAEAAAGAEAAPDRDALWRTAGFARTRFLDDAITAPPRPSPARGPAVAVVEVGGTNGERAPAISCLMVTRDRLALAKRAIRCFGDQTHPERELIIVSEGERDYRTALERYIDQRAIERARVVRAEPGLTLGHLRNMTLDEATGPIACQWDDDDCSHPNRLAEQWEAMEREGADACFLIDHLQYLEQERLIFWIDWTMSGALTDEWQLFPGTVMMRRDERFRYPEAGPYSTRGEDSVMVDQLWHNVPVARVGGMGHLYLYQYHGRNTFSREHHLHITSCAGANERIEAMGEKIREAVHYYPVPKPIPVLGASGPAFVVG